MCVQISQSVFLAITQPVFSLGVLFLLNLDRYFPCLHKHYRIMKGEMQDGSSNPAHIFLDLFQYTANGGKKTQTKPKPTNQSKKQQPPLPQLYIFFFNCQFQVPLQGRQILQLCHQDNNKVFGFSFTLDSSMLHTPRSGQSASNAHDMKQKLTSKICMCPLCMCKLSTFFLDG